MVCYCKYVLHTIGNVALVSNINGRKMGENNEHSSLEVEIQEDILLVHECYIYLLQFCYLNFETRRGMPFHMNMVTSFGCTLFRQYHY